MTSISASFAAGFIGLLMGLSADAATLTVNSAADAGGSCPGATCTLRQAIATAASGDTINFAAGIATITLTSNQLLISKNLTVSGPGANRLTLQRAAAPATPGFRIFDVNAVSFTISGMTIANGHPTLASGGGIRSLGALTLNNVTIHGNSSDAFGGGISITSGTLTIANSTISGNHAQESGGGMYTEGTVNLTNSTISGNSAGGSGGGGIYRQIPATVSITNSTIFGNSADGGVGGGIHSFAFDGVTLKNTIVARNTARNGGADFYGVLISQGYNLISSTAPIPGGGVIVVVGITTGNQLDVDPLLGPLQDNGGPTFTHALLSGSPAIEAGHSSGFGTDQRGFARPVDSLTIPNATGGDGSDIGAYEVQADVLPGCSTINRTVNNNNDTGTDSLRDVIAKVCAGSTITFAESVRGAINLTSGELLLERSLMISGPGADLLSVQRSAVAGTPAFRIFNANFPNNVYVVSGLTIANGSGGNGGAFYNAGNLTVNYCTVSGNTEDGASGGGFYNAGGTLTIANSTVSGNSASSGGGVYSMNNVTAGTLIIISSTVSGNTGGFSGGGIVSTGTATITNSTISGNSAGFGGGGGIANGGNGVFSLRNSIVALNTATTGPDVQGTFSSQGFNVIGSASGGTFTPAQLTDLVTVTAAQLMLGPLQNNGGPTQTHVLFTGSIAIDKGDSAGATTDQRGFARVVDLPGIVNASGGDGSDIGAFEVQAPAVVVEFYNASLDHYFITWVVDEIAKLDAGTVIKGWARTGKAFKSYTTPQSGTSPVCRYYIPPGLGDSHFFGRGTAECSATGQKFPSFVLEDPAFMQMYLPVGGVCPASTTQVFRVFSNRPDANHRYMTDKSVRDQMVAMGWLVEGDGPDAVVMCAPQ